jgi:hypothetical protein
MEKHGATFLSFEEAEEWAKRFEGFAADLSGVWSKRPAMPTPTVLM